MVSALVTLGIAGSVYAADIPSDSYKGRISVSITQVPEYAKGGEAQLQFYTKGPQGTYAPTGNTIEVNIDKDGKATVPTKDLSWKGAKGAPADDVYFSISFFSANQGPLYTDCFPLADRNIKLYYRDAYGSEPTYFKNSNPPTCGES